MSLLSEVATTVGQSVYSQNENHTLMKPQVTQNFPIAFGVPKQVVGYCALGSSEYAFVLDAQTGQPIELPEHYLPVFVFLAPIRECDPLDDISVGFSATDTDLNDSYEITDWYGSDINVKAMYGFGGTNQSFDYSGRRYMYMLNYTFPTPTNAVLKVALQYITFE